MRGWPKGTILLLTMCLLLPGPTGPEPVEAGVGAGRPLRLEGYFGASPEAADVLRMITISPDGRERRSFGVTALQAYKPEEEGTQVLRPSILRPVTFLLRGDRALVERFFDAPSGHKVVAYGVYGGGAGMLTLMGVEVTPLSDPRVSLEAWHR